MNGVRYDVILGENNRVLLTIGPNLGTYAENTGWLTSYSTYVNKHVTAYVSCCPNGEVSVLSESVTDSPAAPPGLRSTVGDIYGMYIA
jgi:hypothetical protein